MSYSPYKNDALRVGQHVRINSKISKYYGVEGTVFSIAPPYVGYAVMEMPKGTELRIEGIKENGILRGLKKETKKRRPQGDPQLFPIGWLEVLDPEFSLTEPSGYVAKKRVRVRILRSTE